VRAHPPPHPSSSSIDSRVLGPILEGAPDTTLQFQHSHQSVGILFGGASVGGSDGEHDGTSVLSATETPGAELFNEYFPKRQDLIGLVGNDCVEQRLFDLCDSDSCSRVEDLIKEIRENPRKSFIARIGLVGISEDLVVMRTQQARWQQAEQAYTTRIQEIFHRRAAPSTSPRCGCQDYHNLYVKLNQILTTHRTFEEHRKHCGRRSKIATTLLAIMQALLDGRESEKVPILLHQ
jgi:hypothetical protein